ncbi:MAG: phosphate-binding protein [Gammaproteobacteria bacterium]|nr:MAG: phosphate-binding protein [Gammaproteobacteria bacterium]
MKQPKIALFSLCLSTVLFTSVAGARTEIQNKGSDTLVNVAQAWAEAYQSVDPEVAVAVSGGGSGTGIAALLNGTVDIANASRQIKSKEMELATKNGIKPVEVVVGYDALAVYLNSANPATTLTIEQLREVFGRGGKATKWTDLGLEVPGCKDQQIIVVSRQNNSGTYAYFKSAVLGKKGKYRQGTLDMHGSKDVVDLVEKTPCAIGYSGLAYATDHIKMACIAESDPASCISPSSASAADKSYPIARPLFMYTNGEPQGAVKTYLDWVMSDAGQCIIAAKGYAPVRDISCE